MRVILDAMGGDNAPLEILRGAALAARACNADIVLVGREEILNKKSEEAGVDISRFEVVNTPEVVTMEDDPIASLRGKKDSSMMSGLRMLSDGKGDAFVSAGNTGALFTGATFIVGRAKGIKRAAIGTLIPGKKPCLLLDAGANISVSAEYLVQFAHMGSDYMSKVHGVQSPAVGLLNNGTEDGKGTPLEVESHTLLGECKDINYVGNVEANAVLFGACDVLVTDGFTGNIFLKSLEGTGKYLLSLLKEVYGKNIVTKASYLAVKNGLSGMKKNFDSSEHGGSPILGIAKPVIKAHGSSDARAIKNAVLQATRCAGLYS